MQDSLPMKPSSSTFSSSLLSISTDCGSSSFSCQGQDSRKPAILQILLHAFLKLKIIPCRIPSQWNRPPPRSPPPCSQSQRTVALPPSPVRVRILESLQFFRYCFMKAQNHSMQDSLPMKPSSSTFSSSSLLSISTDCASSSFSCQGQDSRKPEIL